MPVPCDNRNPSALPTGSLQFPGRAARKALLGTLSATLAATLMVTVLASPGATQPVCSALSKHPCVYHPYHQVCGVFHHRACTYEPNYWFGEELLLTIKSRIATDGQHPSPDAQPSEAQLPPAERPQLRTIGDVFAALRSCWVPPSQDAARPGTQVAVRLSFKRNGELFGQPRVTYVSAGTPRQVRESYWDAITATLKRCTPLQLTKGLGGALAGRPFAIRFVDDRDPS